MSDARIFRQSKWLFLPPVILGGALLAFFLNRGSALERAAITEASRTLRVIPVTAQTLIPRVLGYGTSQPENVWNAVSEVQGDVVEVHPELRTGALFEAGAVLLRIDDTEYQSALTQLRAEQQKTQVELAELDVQQQNLLAALDIDKRAADLATKEVERVRGLVESNAAAQSSLDMAERQLLSQQQSVQTQQNSLKPDSLQTALHWRRCSKSRRRGLKTRNSTSRRPNSSRRSDAESAR